MTRKYMTTAEAKALFDRLYAREQAKQEAYLRTPAGERERQARNEAMLRKMRAKAKLGIISHSKQKARKWNRRHYLAQQSRTLTVKAVVRRGYGKGEAAFEADACLVSERAHSRRYTGGAKRCVYGHGRSPTAAVKSALQGLARSLK